MRLKKGRQFLIPDNGTGEKIKITLIDVGIKEVKYTTPEGLTKTMNLLQFIVMAIPYVDAVISWIKSLFRKK